MLDDLKYIQLLLIFLINFFFLFNLNQISKKISLFDCPDKKLKVHSKKVFIGGGIVFYITFFFIYLSNIFFFVYFFI